MAICCYLCKGPDRFGQGKIICDKCWNELTIPDIQTGSSGGKANPDMLGTSTITFRQFRCAGCAEKDELIERKNKLIRTLKGKCTRLKKKLEKE